MEELAKVAPLSPGEMLDGKYSVVRQLGEGGMGIVYEAHHPLLQKAVAIKVLRPELAQLEERRDRFEAEARATAAVGHPNIVAVTDMGQTSDGALYFVMDYLTGETLADRIRRLQKLDVRSAAVIVLDVLSGLEAAHALMLVHRDLKPDNIFLAKTPGGREIAKILDFGIAKALAAAGKRKVGTQLGFTIGTPMYMAPEQALADVNIDARADLWAMGVIIYEMISGQPPFQSEDTVEVLTRVVAGKRAPLATVSPDAPPALVELVEAALSSDRTKRPQTAAEFAARLQQAVFGTATPAPGMITGGKLAQVSAQVAMNLSALDKPELLELEPAPKRSAVAARASVAAAPAPRAPTAIRPQPTPAPAAAVEEVADTYQELDLSPPRRRKGGKVIVAVAVLAAAAGGAVFFLKGKPENLAALKPAALVKRLTSSAPKPAEAKADDVVWVKFNVVPAHSRIYVDGKPIPSNPAPLTRGQPHNVTAIADGYEIEQMDIKGTSVGTIHMRLEKKRSRR
jgi:eukaryotic-like serine/threonine-protein kinase